MQIASVKTRMKKVTYVVVRVGAVISFVVILILILITLPFLVADLAVALGEVPPIWATWVPEKLTGFSIPLSYYRAILDALLLLTGVWAVVWTFVSAARFKRKLLKRSVVDSFPAGEPGQDLKTMHEHYFGASELTICSGDFDWITRDTNLRVLLEGLANQDKLKLFTDHDIADVRTQWATLGHDQLFEQFQPYLQSVPNGVPKFSLIKHGSEVTFLSYVAVPLNQEIGPTNIAVSSLKGPEARNLVTNIDMLLQSLIANVNVNHH